MIARCGRPEARTPDEALRALSTRQDAAATRGVQQTYSQSQIGRETGLTRARIEQLELVAKLHLLQGLAVKHPRVLLELGAAPSQLVFLESVKISAGNARRLWRRWRQITP